MAEKTVRRKLQVSNGYLLEFDQLARVLHHLLEHPEAKKIYRAALCDDTGLADRQVETLVSIGCAMALIAPGRQILTPFGRIVSRYDIFIEEKGSLEWCHYTGGGGFRNLVWFEALNSILWDSTPGTQEEWTERLRGELAGRYTERTIKKSLHEEVRFVVDAYLERNFRKLELLHRDPAGRLYRRRYTEFEPPVLCAMIYDYCAARGLSSPQVKEMAEEPGSPAIVFGLDVATFRQWIEDLHERGWLRYETTHNLDQIRLIPGFGAIEFLEAHYEGRAPRRGEEAPPERHTPRRGGQGRGGQARREERARERRNHGQRDDAALGAGAEETTDPPPDPQQGLFE
jgi:hypothetical protein